MSCFLITGATGFIGQNLVEFLTARGHHVRCLVRPGTSAGISTLEATKCEIRRGALDDEACLADAIDGVDVVVHLAGMTAAFSKRELLEVNGEGAGRMARVCACRETPPILVHVSSIAAAGPIERGRLRVEDDPCAPVSDYGESKLAGERAVQQWGHALPVTILRPGAIFGPRDTTMLPVYKAIRRMGLHAVPAFRPPPISFLYVDDLSALIEKAALGGERLPAKTSGDGNGHSAPLGTGIYFAVGPEHPDYSELGRMIGPLIGRPNPIIFNMPGPMPLVIAGVNQLLARLKGRPNPFSRDKIREGRATSWACSHVKAAEQLNFRPERPLAERLEATVAWYRKEKWL